jgi:hypothetical protein
MYTFVKNSLVNNLIQEEFWIDTEEKRLKRIWRLSTNDNVVIRTLGQVTLARLLEGVNLEIANTAKISNLDFVLPILETGALEDGDGYYIIHPLHDGFFNDAVDVFGNEAFADQIVNMYAQLKAAGYYKIQWIKTNIIVDFTLQKLYIFGFLPLTLIASDTNGTKKSLELAQADATFQTFDGDLVARIQAVINS